MFNDRTRTREEIVALFRQRIAQKQRTKLSQQERSELARHFIDRLSQCNSEEEAIALCQAEIALLEEGYPVASVANQYLPEWRRAITLAVEEGRLPKQDLEPTEFGRVYSHWGLKHLLYPNEVYQGLKRVTTERNNRKQDALRPIEPQRFISTAERLLDGQSPHEWAVGLLALTGRRFSEIVAKGEFSPTTHPYAIAFRGQLKKGIQNPEDAQTFAVATLIEADKVLKAIEKFRAHPRIQELADLTPDEINSRSNTTVRHTIKREFEDTGIIPLLEGEKSVSAHNLRGCYAEIAIHFFCPPNQSAHRFIQSHLGHIIGEQDLASRKNAGATEHYFHYRLTDSTGAQLNQKGILLEQVGGRLPIVATTIDSPQTEQPPTPEPEPEPEPIEIETVETEGEEPMAVNTSKQRPPRSCVPSVLMQEFKKAARERLGKAGTGTAAQIMLAVIAHLRTQTQEPATPTESIESISALAPTFQWFTTEIERLRQEVERLRQEKEVLAIELEQARAVQTEHPEIERLRAENARLRTEAEQFQQIRQMLGGTAAAPITPTTPRTAPQAPPRRSTEAAPRRSREDSDGKIDEAINLLKSWNDNPAVDCKQKWFISVPVILQLMRGSGYSVSQGRVQEALKERGEEIQQHHAAHGLGQRHNAKHSSPVTDDITVP